MPKEPPPRRRLRRGRVEERREDGGGARKLVLAEDVGERRTQERESESAAFFTPSGTARKSIEAARAVDSRDGRRQDGRARRSTTDFFGPPAFCPLPMSDTAAGRRVIN